MRNHSSSHPGFSLKSITLAIAVFAGGCIVLLWSWNTLAGDLFNLPHATFKHALAFGLVLLVAGLWRGFAARIAGRPARHAVDHPEAAS